MIHSDSNPVIQNNEIWNKKMSKFFDGIFKIFYKMRFWFSFLKIFTIIQWWNNGFEAERNPSLKVELKVKCQDEMIDVILVYRVPCLENSGGKILGKKLGK